MHRALQPKRRRVKFADRSVSVIGTVQADDRDFGRIFIHDRHVHRCAFAPKAEQAQASLRQFVGHEPPQVSTDHGARPWPPVLDLAALQYAIDQRWHILSISQLSKKTSHMLEPGDERRGKIDARDQNQ